VIFTEQVSGSIAMLDIERRGPMVSLEFGLEQTDDDSFEVLCSRDDARAMAEAILSQLGAD